MAKMNQHKKKEAYMFVFLIICCFCHLVISVFSYKSGSILKVNTILMIYKNVIYVIPSKLLLKKIQS